MSSAYHQTIFRAFRLAGESGESCRPIHVFAALAEGDGPVAAALNSGRGPVLARPTDPVAVSGGSAGYLVRQLQQAAQRFASKRGADPVPEHLFLAGVDQSEPEAMAALVAAGLQVAALRATVQAALGEPPDLAPITMPPLTPAGTLDRPPLPIGELDPAAWAALEWRQDHLPLRRLSRRSHFEALRHLEHKAAWRLADRLGLDDDQRYSLVRQHVDRVEQIVAIDRQDLGIEVRSQRRNTVRTARPLRRANWWRHRRWLRFTVGWGCWFSNRRVGLRDRWFGIRTLRDYRGAPKHQNPVLGH